MNRSRTFTRELNDPKAEDDLIIEELEPKIVPKKHVKRFKLNTTQIEVNIFLSTKYLSNEHVITYLLIVHAFH